MNHIQFPLHCAAYFYDLEGMQSSLNQGIPIDHRDCLQYTPLHCVETKEAAEFLINNKCDLDAKTYKGTTALMLALSRRFIDVAILLVESGADVNCCNIYNWNALHFACDNLCPFFDTLDHDCRMIDLEQYGIVQLLVSKVSNINAVTTDSGDTALSLAAVSRQEDVVNLLIQSGANAALANVTCGLSSFSFLHWAACEGWTEIAGATVNEFDVNATTVRGHTALMLAAKYKHYGMVDLLLKCGADIYLKHDNHTALFEAIPDVEIITLLINNGAYLEPLDYAEIYKNVLCREHILKNTELCAKILINKYNNLRLPRVYQIYSSANKLPLINSLKIKNNQSVISEIKTSVGHEIQMKAFCNVMEVRFLPLQMLAVRSLIAR